MTPTLQLRDFLDTWISEHQPKMEASRSQQASALWHGDNWITAKTRPDNDLTPGLPFASPLTINMRSEGQSGFISLSYKNPMDLIDP